jgi:SAM-dependent methyltransferase
VADAAFDRCAARYDELRPQDAGWWELFDRLVALGELRGERVLEVGCGTGRLAQALDERALARVWAVDASSEMVARTKSLGVNARVARAEALPFKRGWFGAVVMRMALHLLDRPRALAEASRVLAPNGRLLIASMDPDRFDDVWFGRWFPSVAELERGRFPDETTLRAELEAAGLPEVQIERLAQARTMAHAHGLDVVRSKAYSTFELLPPEEYERGLALAEAEPPAEISYTFGWLLAVARRPD